MKWLDVFKNFDCEIHYHPGKENVFIDALTQNPTSEPIQGGLFTNVSVYPVA